MTRLEELEALRRTHATRIRNLRRTVRDLERHRKVMQLCLSQEHHTIERLRTSLHELLIKRREPCRCWWCRLRGVS